MIGRVVSLKGTPLDNAHVHACAARGRVRDTATVYDPMHEKLVWYLLVEELDTIDNGTGMLTVWQHTDVILEGAR